MVKIIIIICIINFAGKINEIIFKKQQFIATHIHVHEKIRFAMKSGCIQVESSVKTCINEVM